MKIKGFADHTATVLGWVGTLDSISMASDDLFTVQVHNEN